MWQGIKTNIYIRIALHVNCLYSPELPFTVAKLRFAKAFSPELRFTSLLSCALPRVVNGRVTQYLSRLHATQNNRHDLPCCPCRCRETQQAHRVGQKRACLAALLYHKRICLGPDCASSSCHTQLATHKWSVHNKKLQMKIGRQWSILNWRRAHQHQHQDHHHHQLQFQLQDMSWRAGSSTLFWADTQKAAKENVQQQHVAHHAPAAPLIIRAEQQISRIFNPCPLCPSVCVCDFPIEFVLLAVVKWVSPHCTPRWTATMWSTMARSTMTPRVSPTWIGPSWLRCVLWG